ncbi:unnamed protein product [Calypogeia fissa]
MLLPHGCRVAMCKNGFSVIKKSGRVFRSLRTSLAPALFASSCLRGTMTHSTMSITTPAWMPVLAAVGDNSQPGVDPKCVVRIVSYNILAQVYVKSVNFPTSPRASLRWKNRSEAVVSRLLSLDADLLCLQEVDEFDTFYKQALRRAGYESIYIQRGNQKRDGCCIFFRDSKVSLLTNEVIDYNDLVPPLPEDDTQGGIAEDSGGNNAQERGDLNDVRVRLQRDCVGIIAAFRPVDAPTRILIVANTHIFWDPVLMDVKLAQVRYLADRLLAFQKRIAEEFDIEPLLLVAGDFNSLPGDTVYNYVTSGVDQAVKVNAVENMDTVIGSGLSISPEHGLPVELDEAEGECMIEFVGKFPLPVVSLYAFVDKEPPATNYTHNFVGTLDYIFFIPSRHLKAKSLLALPPRDAPEVVTGLPNHRHPSDHLPIGSDFEIY